MNGQDPGAAQADPTARTFVITGGSDGMGRALALGRAARGDRVLAVGSSSAKGTRLLAEAEEAGVAGRIDFLAADLSTVAGSQSVIDRVAARYGRIDGLVLGANRQFPRRVETADGFEATFALYYLSRAILSRGLVTALSSGVRPVIVNIAGTGITAGRIRWSDPQLRRGYRTVAAQIQAGRANDLLGVAMAEEYGDRVPYVLFNPGFTKSGDAAMEQLRPSTRALIKALAAIAAKPVERAVAPVHEVLDAPPAARLTALARSRPLPLDLPTLDPGAARRLAGATAQMLSSAAEPPPADGSQS